MDFTSNQQLNPFYWITTSLLLLLLVPGAGAATNFSTTEKKILWPGAFYIDCNWFCVYPFMLENAIDLDSMQEFFEQDSKSIWDKKICLAVFALISWLRRRKISLGISFGLQRTLCAISVNTWNCPEKRKIAQEWWKASIEALSQTFIRYAVFLYLVLKTPFYAHLAQHSNHRRNKITN